MFDSKNHRQFSSCGTDDGINCIDTYRITDSCKIKEYASDIRIFLTVSGESAVDTASSIRVKETKILWTGMTTDKVPFSKGFYQVNIRYYFSVTLECCSPFGEMKEALGFCFYDKSTVLFGGETYVSAYRTDVNASFCGGGLSNVEKISRSPRAVIETCDPIALKITIKDRPGPFESLRTDTIPEIVSSFFNEKFSDAENGRKVFITLGIFSMLRMERPAQLIIPACDLCIPRDEAGVEYPENDASALFKEMEFPVEAFFDEISPDKSNPADIRTNKATASISQTKNEA